MLVIVIRSITACHHFLMLLSEPQKFVSNMPVFNSMLVADATPHALNQPETKYIIR